MTMIVFLFLVVSVRTNIAFFIVFLALDTCLGLVTGAYWQLAADYAGNAAFATKLLVVSFVDWKPPCIPAVANSMV